MVKMVKRKYATTVPKDEADNKEPKCQKESGFTSNARKKAVSFNKKQYDSG